MKNGSMWRLLAVVPLLAMLLAPPALAEASGPDFYQVRAKARSAALREGPSGTAAVIGLLYPSYGALKSLGCSGGPSFAEWQKLPPAEQAKAGKAIWCKVEIAGLQGWVQNNLLAEYVPPRTTPFNCARASREIELLVCNEPALQALDRLMDETYARALAVASSLGDRPDRAVRLLKAVQRGWVGGRNECWKDQGDKAACARNAYELRLAQLEAQWNLVPPRRTERYACADGGEFFVRHYPTRPRESVVVERGDGREIMVRATTDGPGAFTGEFGKALRISGAKGELVWDQFQPALTCSLDPAVTIPGFLAKP